MSERIRRSRKIHVIAAIVVVVALAVSLGMRLAARTDRLAERSTVLTETEVAATVVPAPRSFRMTDLEIPHWSHQDSRNWPVRFRTDLDLLAPLGNGGRNAAEWFVDFRGPDGPRHEEARAMMERVEDRGGNLANVLPPDDPLLLEAEPWCDQAEMIFYPELLKPTGWNTQMQNHMVPLILARSWMARGLESPDPEQGLADCRRAVRLGRLLRQDDTIYISDLVGLACIRMGAQGIFDIAVKQGDAELALLASIVIGEVAPQRLHTSERITRTWDKSFLREDRSGNLVLDMPDEKLEPILEMAREESDRRFRVEAILALNVVRFMGTEAQKERAVALLTELSAVEDPVLSEFVRFSLEKEPNQELLRELM